MNPYNQLKKIAGTFSHRATLTKNDGRVLNLYVKPETITSENLNANVPATMVVREWTCDVNDLIVDSESYYPDAGDLLTVFSDTGEPLRYDCARDATSGRYWDWMYLRPGYRVKFYTKYNPKEIPL